MATALPAAPAAPAGPAAPADPVLRIQAILEAENTPRPDAPKAPPQLGEGEQQPAPSEQPQEGDYEPQGNKQVEGDEGDEGDESKPAPNEIPLDQLEAIELETTVKGEDGKDIVERPTIKELRLGYMRQRDYQRKTAEVARQRESVAEEITKRVETERTQYLHNLQELQNTFVATVAPELQNVDWNNLATNDAFEYVRLRNRADQITQALSSIQVKQREATQKADTDRKALMQKAAQKSREILEADIPGWNDALYQTLMKSSETVGYKPEEVATWVDARAIKLLHKAHLYDQLKAKEKTPEPGKKVVVTPTVVRPGAANNASQRQQQEQGAMKRLQGSGKLEDAAAVIRSRLG